MENKLTKILKVVMLLLCIFVGICFVFAIGLALVSGMYLSVEAISNISLQVYAQACNEIGYSNYKHINNANYCTNDSINLYAVNIECNFWRNHCKATQLNLHTYQG